MAQEVWIKVVNNLCRFRGESSFKSWVYRITANHCMTHLRSAKRSKEECMLSDPDGIPNPQTWCQPDHKFFAMEMTERVEKALQGLPSMYRDPLNLRKSGGCTYREIAATLGLGVNTIRSRIFRGRRLLERKLSGGGSSICPD